VAAKLALFSKKMEERGVDSVLMSKEDSNEIVDENFPRRDRNLKNGKLGVRSETRTYFETVLLYLLHTHSFRLKLKFGKL
jgi:hypothetical protein